MIKNHERDPPSPKTIFGLCVCSISRETDPIELTKLFSYYFIFGDFFSFSDFFFFENFVLSQKFKIGGGVSANLHDGKHMKIHTGRISHKKKKKKRKDFFFSMRYAPGVGPNVFVYLIPVCQTKKNFVGNFWTISTIFHGFFGRVSV